MKWPLRPDSMDNGHFWLLDGVATFRMPIQWLAARNLDEFLNREGHGLSVSEIAVRVADLLDAGHIAVRHPIGSGGQRTLLTGQELAEVLVYRSDAPLYYGLTESGG